MAKVAVLSPFALACVFGSGAGSVVLAAGLLNIDPLTIFLGATLGGLNAVIAWGLGREAGSVMAFAGGFWRTNHAAPRPEDDFDWGYDREERP